MTKTRLILLTLILLAAFFSVDARAAVRFPDTVRVLVLDRAEGLNINGTGDTTLDVRSERGAVSVNGKVTAPPLKLYPRDKFIYINGRPYRGAVEVTASRDALRVVNELSLEDYLVGVINNEISSKWHAEAVKAQAVVARTYALYQMNSRTGGLYDIEGTVMGQVYSGALSEDEASARAVRETAGEILTFIGEPALTVYHSNAGGMTDASRDIWAEDYPYLKSVLSPYDSSAPKYAWEFIVPASSFKAVLNKAGYSIGDPREIRLDELSPAGRVKSLVISDSARNGLRLRGEDLRKILGYSFLRSSAFEVWKKGDLFVFRGRGSGHGVGMSQWGAKGMAENGYSYKDILMHFYPGTRLTKAY